MNAIALLGTLLGLGVTSGLNLYATVFATGIAIRLGWVQPPAALEGLAVLGDPTVLLVSGVLYALEFVADKVPVVEHAWDLFHTIVRPLGAIWIGLLATSHAGMTPSAELVLLMLMGGAAFTAHLGKAGMRLISATGGGHILGIGLILSVLEDLFSLGVAPAAVIHPMAALVAALAVLVAIAVVVPLGYRYFRSLLRG
jgi:Domain of unknown function (DUF4126)